jgi:Ni,Fe-hydrogenase III small subunit/NAD-dependent dihydropyrimidine dehydrogenase PreA subunit
MLNIVRARLQQGCRTVGFPTEAPVLPERFRGRPTFDESRCPDGCRACVDACPTGAIFAETRGLAIDLGRCLFCTDCEAACPAGALRHAADHRLAASDRQSLVIRESEQCVACEADARIRRLFGRSLKLRQVSAGGCNGCEADVNVLNSVVFDLGRFGIQFVASPRHADGLLITGPVSRNMELALRKTFEAVPPPRVVIAVGACAISGGPYVDHPEVCNGAGRMVPVDLYIPGCPPHPVTILDGLLRWLGRMDDQAGAGSEPARGTVGDRTTAGR